MERICTQCHAILGATSEAIVCPACQGKLIEGSALPPSEPLAGPPTEVDHRGILLPRRHALGGIISPQ
jgi:hypothetical protein